VFQQSIKAKLLDPGLRFAAAPQEAPGPDALGKMNDWFHNLFEQREAAQAQAPAQEAALPDVPQPEQAQPRPATGTASVDTTVVPPEYQRSETVRVMPGGPATSAGGFEIQPPPRQLPRPAERAPDRLERPDGPFVVGAPSLGTPSIGPAGGSATPGAEPAPQPARGSPSVRFESAPDSGSEPAR
jgi:hypothetical protein